MIFGFNTDIKQGENAYHVQSEARVGEQLLQTQVFVHGRCIAKRAVSYAERAEDPSFTEEVMHETLREQHRWVLDAIRDGYIDELVKGSEETSSDGEQLVLRFTGSSRPTTDCIVLCFQVSFGANLLSEASVEAHLIPVRSQMDGFERGSSAAGVTDLNGVAEIRLPIAPGAHGQARLVIQATHDSHKTTKKFCLKVAPTGR